MPIGYDQEVELRIAAKTSGGNEVEGLADEIKQLQTDLREFDKIGRSVSVLEKAQASVRDFESGLAQAQAKVRTLQATLSEAYAVGVDASGIKSLEKQLSAAEREASRAETSLTKAQAAIVSLNLAADRTGVSTGNLASKKAELAQNAAFATGKIEQLREQLLTIQSAEDRAGASARQLGQSFDTIGIRSAEQIKADILAINQALQKLAQNSNLSAEEFQRAFSAAEQKLIGLKQELHGLPTEKAASGMQAMGSALDSLKAFAQAYIGVDLAGKFLEANLAADKLKKALDAINGDSGKSASDLEFLRKTADRLGIDLNAASAGFIKMSAASKGTSLEGQATREIFSNLAGAMSRLGLSSAETERAFVAISQMMSKGTVNAEELKGQLGDVLPGALSLAAKSMGVTTSELSKMMEQGQVLAEDFLPGFARQVATSFGESGTRVEGLSNSFARMKNLWVEISSVIGDGGGMKVIGSAAAIANGALAVIVTTIGMVINGLSGMAEAFGIVAGAIASGNWSGVSDELAKIGNRVDKTNKQLGDLSNRALGLSSDMDTVGSASKKAGEDIANSSDGSKALAVAYSAATKQAGEYVELSKKVVKSAQEEGEYKIRLAELGGNEIEVLNARKEAAFNNAEAAKQLAHALDTEAKTLQSKVVAMEKEAEKQGQVSEEKKKAIEEAKKLADAKTEEANAAGSVAAKAVAESAAVASSSAALADNSGRVNELRAAWEQAQVVQTAVHAQRIAGTATQEQENAASVAAQQAQNLYRDALNDVAVAIQNKANQQAGEINLQSAGIRLAIEQQKTKLEVAKATGNEYGASVALAEIKKLEIQLAELNAKSKAAEANAALMIVQAKRAELEASGQLTPAKKAELDAQELSAKAKQVEAKISGEMASRMKELADTTNFSADSARQAADAYGAIGDRAGSSVDGVERLNDAMSKTPSGGGAGAGKSEQQRTATGEFDFAGAAYQKGASIEQVKAAQKYFGELLQRENAAVAGQKVMSVAENFRRMRGAQDRAIEQALQLAQQEIQTGKQADLGTPVADLIAQQMATHRVVGPEAFNNAQAAAGRAAQAQRIRIDIGSGQQKATVFADNKSAADQLIKTLQVAGMRSKSN